MNRTLNKKFNHEISIYKNSLLFYAKQCDWETFKSRAGSLFDYIESVEMKEIERKFFKIFKVILSFLFFAVFIIVSINPESYPEMSRIKETMILAALAGCCYELFSFMNFCLHMNKKKTLYKKRRARFIINIHSDFRDVIVPSVVEQVSTAPQATAEPEQVLQNAF